MRGHRGLGLLVALVGALAAAGVFAGGAPAQGGCAVQLRVNVFGSSPPGPSWAKHGGLNAGAQATLRAVARGCGVDHISRRWVTGGPGGISKRPCSGATTCIWNQSAPRQSAADYQAFATSGGVRSNIVRVAWAGACTAVGTWTHRTAIIGSTTWTVMRGGHAQETGIGSASGMATLAGHTLTIVFVASDGVTKGVYTWTLRPNCASGQGTLRFTGPPSRAGETHASTVTKG